MSQQWSCLIAENRVSSLCLYCERRMKRCSWKRTWLFFEKLLYFIHWISKSHSTWWFIYSKSLFPSEVNTGNPDTLQEVQQNAPFLFFWFKVKMETAYLSETFHLAINKGISDIFWDILIIHLQLSFSDPCKNLVDYLNGLRIILHGIFSFPYIYSGGKKPLTHSIIFVILLRELGM